jgi:hypothetical protein
VGNIAFVGLRIDSRRWHPVNAGCTLRARTPEEGSAMPGTRLQPSEREFFATLDDVVYGNPFSDEREKAILRLVPGPRPRTWRATQVRCADGRAALRRVPHASDAGAPGREGPRAHALAFLYVCYHHHVAALDELIAREVAGRTRRRWSEPAAA